MNKKIRIVSTVALASLLTLNVFNPKMLQAAADGLNTKYIGKPSVEGYSNVVAYVLNTNKDTLTLSEIEANQRVDANHQLNVNQAGTGAKFNSNGTPNTILVYGDVDGNGLIGMRDAREVAQYVATEGKTELNALQREAGDVDANKGLQMRDAREIAKFVANDTMEYVTSKNFNNPVVPVDPSDPITANYVITVNDTANEKLTTASVVNNTNLDGNSKPVATVRIAPKSGTKFENGKTLYVTVTDKDGKVAATTGTVSLSDSKAYVDTSAISLIDASSNELADGTLTIKVYKEAPSDATVKPIQTTTITKNTVTPTATNVKARRDETRNGYISLETGYDGNISKIEYAVYDGSTVVVAKTTETVSGNKVNDLKVAGDLDTGKPYTVKYTLINEYGSKSVESSTIIASDATAEKQKAVVIDTVNSNVSAHWTFKTENTVVYGISLLDNNNKVLKTIPTTGNGSNKTVTVNDFRLTSDELKAGNYSISVYAEGTAAKAASDTITSGKVEIKQLQSISDLKFEAAKNGNVTLKFTDNNDEDTLDAVADTNYTIAFKQINKKGELENVNASTGLKVSANEAVKIEEHEVALTNFNTNTVYVAYVTVPVKAQEKYIASEEAKTVEYCLVKSATISSTTTTTLTVSATDADVKILGKTPTYKVEVIPMDGIDGQANARPLTAQAKTVTFTAEDLKNEKFVVTGLTGNTQYRVTIIAETPEGTFKSIYRTVRTSPNFTNIKVVDSLKNIKSAGNVYYDAANSKLYMYGHVDEDGNLKEVAPSDYSAAQTAVTNQIALIAKLAKDDEASINDTEIALNLKGVADDRDFSSVNLEGVTLKINNNGNSKEIKTASATSGATQAPLNINLLSGTFDMSSATAKEEITVAPGVDVTASSSKKYTITPCVQSDNNSRVKFNNVTYIKSTEKIEVEIAPTASNVNLVTVNVDGTPNNYLEFNNASASDALDVMFRGVTNGGGSIITGTVKILANNGKNVTVRTDNKTVSVQSKLDVTVSSDADGKTPVVTLTDTNITSSKEDKVITFTKTEDKDATNPVQTATVKVIAKEAAPVAFKAIKLTADLDEALDAAVAAETATAGSTGVTAANRDSIKKYLVEMDCFGLSGTEAVITIAANANDSNALNELTIVLNDTLSSKKITNVK